jgi:hypothetical protein
MMFLLQLRLITSNYRKIGELDSTWKEEVWPILSCYPRILLQILKQTTKKLSQDSRDLKSSSPKYETGVLITQQKRSLCIPSIWYRPINTITKDKTFFQRKIILTNTSHVQTQGVDQARDYITRDRKIFLWGLENFWLKSWTDASVTGLALSLYRKLCYISLATKGNTAHLLKGVCCFHPLIRIRSVLFYFIEHKRIVSWNN